MRGAGADLTEYVIGVEVLGRPEGYSPAEDSSVRTRAYELRQKLEKLYSTELQAEAIQIVVPKGAYTPHYVKPSTLPHRDSLTEVTPAAEARSGGLRHRAPTSRRLAVDAGSGPGWSGGDICGFAVACP